MPPPSDEALIAMLDRVPWRSFSTTDSSGPAVRDALRTLLAAEDDEVEDAIASLRYDLSIQDTWPTEAAAAALPYMLAAAQNPGLSVRVTLLALALELVRLGRQGCKIEIDRSDSDLRADQQRLLSWSQQLVQAAAREHRRLSALREDTDTEIRAYAALLQAEIPTSSDAG